MNMLNSIINIIRSICCRIAPTATILLLMATTRADHSSAADGDRILLRGQITCDQLLPFEAVLLQARYVHFRPEYASREVDQKNEELPPEFVVDSHGRFEFDRKKQPMLLYCKSADGKFAGSIAIIDETTEIEIELKPVVTLRGRLIDHETNKAMPSERVLAGIHFDSGDRGVMEGGLFGHGVTTGEKGEFEFLDLVADQKYDLARVVIDIQRTISIYPQGTVATDSRATIDVSDVDVTRQYFATDTMPLVRLQESLRQGRLSNQHILIVFSSPGDESFRSYLRLRINDREIEDAMDEFQLLVVDRTGESAAALALANELKVDLPTGFHGAYFCFLNESGCVSQEFNVVSSEEQPFPRTALLEAALANAARTHDAHELLGAALKLAEMENKLVLLQETGPGCGPCILMSRFLESTREYWADDFVWLQLDDRWPGTIEITTQLRNNETLSIPWYGVLDSERRLLFTSLDQDGKNMGFPGSDRSRKHFRKMLQDHVQNMTDERIDAMLRELDK